MQQLEHYSCTLFPSPCLWTPFPHFYSSFLQTALSLGRRQFFIRFLLIVLEPHIYEKDTTASGMKYSCF